MSMSGVRKDLDDRGSGVYIKATRGKSARMQAARSASAPETELRVKSSPTQHYAIAVARFGRGSRPNGPRMRVCYIGLRAPMCPATPHSSRASPRSAGNVASRPHRRGVYQLSTGGSSQNSCAARASTAIRPPPSGEQSRACPCVTRLGTVDGRRDVHMGRASNRSGGPVHMGRASNRSGGPVHMDGCRRPVAIAARVYPYAKSDTLAPPSSDERRRAPVHIVLVVPGHGEGGARLSHGSFF
jgi:hypothetical protein